ncbi:MAG: long-chain-fatty-acid--CoA ligase [Paludibacterium sp.]|uniref:long-chain-fatty-acid--CoA ligase n=1 Tax=Paludibacterium sp. TaxID=1917523 RepID=UPI0025EFF605|nr:long-chain-fatty-acid--CoA ligase [Paludibacterium sp.]MBV8048841.1 long-chain-fatty-acid--CoA ligase [Paludibacterium sp.]MBV8646502.1 long-chain-fatty-acid--CoA ligase [Paludibacterium sp.]
MANDRIWLKSYPPGVPAEIDPAAYASLTQLMAQSFQQHAQRKAYSCMGHSMRYGELDQQSRALAAWLQSAGLMRGSRVAVMMPNILQYPLAVAAILRAGMTVVNVNPLYTPRELLHQLNDSGAEAIIVLENFASTLAEVLAKTSVRHVLLTRLGDLLGPLQGPLTNLVVRKVKKMVPPYRLPQAVWLKTALAKGHSLPLQPVDLGHEDIAFLQYTGGTTGVAKGAVLTHRNIIANMLQNDAWAGVVLRRVEGQLVILSALPLYHILSLTACMMMGTHWGAHAILIPNPRDMPGLVKTLARHRVHFFPGVNTLFNGLLNQPGIARVDFSQLKISLGGGMAVLATTSERWQKVTGTPILEGYGLTETSPCATLNPPDIKGFTGAIGLPIPSTDIAILDDGGNHLPPGSAGEIAIRGPQVMRGYWNRPRDTAQVMTADGFFRTGDVGVMDAAGFVRIVDRKKDMILVSGFNVYPNEIEAVISTHPGVLECACIGVPDAQSGEAVKLFVVPRDPALNAEQLLQFCKEQLTGYKKPRYIVFRNELPKTNVGKILRRALREEQQPS